MTNALRDSRVTFVEASINDAVVTDDVLRGAHAVVHFAAESHVDNSIDGARVFYETNVLGTQQLLNSARNGGVERFVHVSTMKCTDRLRKVHGGGSLARTQLTVLVAKAGSDWRHWLITARSVLTSW